MPTSPLKLGTMAGIARVKCQSSSHSDGGPLSFAFVSSARAVALIKRQARRLRIRFVLIGREAARGQRFGG
jgi:hypothetical protein